MKLTIDETLQRGIAAHTEGKLQDAERLYRAILHSQPTHADANHNLGVLAALENKTDAALRLFKIALTANPKKEQFWFSYIDALIKEQKFKAAKQVIEQVKSKGMAADKLTVFEKQILSLNQVSESLSAPPKKKPTFPANRKNLAEAKKGKKKEKRSNAGNRPADAEVNELLLAYRNKKFDDAEELAISLTERFPKHPFAWKILGTLFGQSGRHSEAAKASQVAVALSPQDVQVLNNLAIALKNLGRLDEAVASYTQAIALMPHLAELHNNLGNTLQALGRLDEAVASYRQAILLKPDYVEAHYNLGNTLQALGRLDEAVASHNQAILLKPDYVEAHNNLGITLNELGRLFEAEASFTEAITLKPDYADAHRNLGVTLKGLGRLNEAEASYREAIALRPDYAVAHYNLGNTLQALGRLDEAVASHNQAILLKSDYAEAYSNLGNTLKELGRLDEAVVSYCQAIALEPDSAGTLVNLCIALKNVEFKSSNPKLYFPLTQLLTVGNLTRPIGMAGSILSLLKHDPLIKDVLLEKNFAMSLEEATSIIKSLYKLSLLHHLMRVCPLPDHQFEGLFVTIRRLLLKNLDKVEAFPELIYFLSTLSLHCFTNEYIYYESGEEIHLIGELQTKVSEAVVQAEQPEAIKVLCLASYRPLHQYDWCQKLESLDNLEEVKRRLIEEPFLEKAIAKDIPVLEKISDDVSLKVREQYEENPYPRWVKPEIATKAKLIAVVCDELKLQLRSENIKSVTAPAILIAGCGTGQQSVETASRFSNCHATAVDLSLASLAYAQRKSSELSFINIDYLQADILHLGQMDKKFDIIESTGVLHHMDEPMAGWRVLVNMLKPGGLMKIGLYSELARRNIVKIREEITLLGVGSTEADIRKFRRPLVESHDENHQLLTKSIDFFSLSTLRDLIFHVQEHQFTVPQIKNCLDELGLEFCGFEVHGIVSRFKEFFVEEADIYDLALWHQYEESNPQAFAGMYQFWCQKL